MYSADRFLIATGSKTRVPRVQGLDEAGFITFKDAVNLTRLPEEMFILGGGPVGCEFAPGWPWKRIFFVAMARPHHCHPGGRAISAFPRVFDALWPAVSRRSGRA